MKTLFSLIWKIDEETSGISISPFKSWVVDKGAEKTISIPFSGCSMRSADIKRKQSLAGISTSSLCLRSMPAGLPLAVMVNG